MNAPRTITLFRSPAQACSYLAGRQAVNEWVDPGVVDAELYDRLIELGFRRSGSHVYRPRCPECSACISMRVDVALFRPARRDRRCLVANADLSLSWAEPECSEAHFALYRRYLAARHPGGGMDNPTPESFRQFLVGDWSRTRFLEMRRDGKLLAVAVTDRVRDGLSAVYCFFEPEASRRGLGNFALLSQIRLAREAGLRWLYLGYWIESSKKMAYKGRFRPAQGFIAGGWRPLP